MRRNKDVWDKILPIPKGQAVRFVLNDAKRKYKYERWFEARDKAIGRLARIVEVYQESEDSHRRYDDYFKHGGRLYEIKFEKSIDGYLYFHCVREEVEVV